MSALCPRAGDEPSHYGRTNHTKDAGHFRRRPNLADYGAVRAGFDWRQARALLDALPGGRGLNIAHEAVDRHTDGLRADASRCAGSAKAASGGTLPTVHWRPRPTGSPTRSAASASGPVDGCSCCSGGYPSCTIAVLGGLKAKCVVSPLFSAFGPEPIATRMEIGGGQVLVTTEALYRRKVEALRSRLPSLAHVILVDDGPPVAGTIRWQALMAAASDVFAIPPTDPEDMALLHFTSGTLPR